MGQKQNRVISFAQLIIKGRSGYVLRPSKTNPHVKRWQRAESLPEAQGRPQDGFPLALDALKRTGRPPSGTTPAAYTASDGQGHTYLVKPRLPLPAIQGEIIAPAVARAVGLQAPANVGVLDRGRVVGIASPIEPGLSPLQDVWEHPQALLALSIKEAVGDSDFEGQRGDNILLDSTSRLWVLDFADVDEEIIGGWLRGKPEGTFNLTTLYAEYYPQQIEGLIEGWKKALRAPSTTFENPSVRLIGDPRRLQEALEATARRITLQFGPGTKTEQVRLRRL